MSHLIHLIRVNTLNTSECKYFTSVEFSKYIKSETVSLSLCTCMGREPRELVNFMADDGQFPPKNSVSLKKKFGYNY